MVRGALAAGGRPVGEAAAVAALARELAAITTRPWTLMEVCGGQTHAIVRWGLDQLLPPGVRLIHGPGCPVCVTPASTIEAALALARRPDVILASYGDMLRVPGRRAGDDLLGVRAAGGDVRLLTSPLEALDLALAHPQRQVVFLAVGFETTAPATALLARQVRQRGVRNLSLLVAHVRVVPAMDALLEDPAGPGSAGASGVQGFLAAGHVATVMGTDELEGLVGRHRLPVVVTGFEPVDLLRGVLACVRRLEQGAPAVENAYGRVVRSAGNAAARALLAEVFVPVDLPWRGLGVIPGGGLALAPAWADLDARLRFGFEGAGAAAAGVGAEPMAVAGAEDVAGGEVGGGAVGAAEAGIGAEARSEAGAGNEAGALGRARVSASAVAGTVKAGAARGLPSGPAAAAGSGALPEPPQAPLPDPEGDARCIAGTILRGRATPADCPAFGGACTPEHPLGAPMVSGEGACAAWYRYRPVALARHGSA